MVLSYVLLAVSFAMLLAGAFIFTNAVEWAGLRLNLGHGATGSILAAVATALPESVIPIVAIVTGGAEGAIAVGAILARRSCSARSPCSWSVCARTPSGDTDPRDSS